MFILKGDNGKDGIVSDIQHMASGISQAYCLFPKKDSQ